MIGKKLKCRPGYVQHGAACKPIKNGSTPAPKPSGRRRKGIASALVGAAVVGAGAAAMVARGKQVPHQAQASKQLPKEVHKAVHNAIDKKAAASKQRVPPIVKDVAKQVAIDVAAKIPARIVGGAVAGAGVQSGHVEAGAMLGQATQASVGYKTRKLLEKKYGAGLKSRKGRVAVSIGVNLAEAGIQAAIAHAAIKHHGLN